MGTSPTPTQPTNIPEQIPSRVTYHSHPNLPDLLRIFKLFIEQPYKYIYSIEFETMQQNCCDRTILKIRSPFYTSNLDSVLNHKRKTKGFFVQKQIWYVVKTLVLFFAYLEGAGLVFGVITPRSFNLDKGRFITADILHLLPYNQHDQVLSIHNYYSPQKIAQISNEQLLYSMQTLPASYKFSQNGIKQMNIFKSEVFSLGLLILQIATCPFPRPKFHKPSLKQLLWSQINNRYQMTQQRYSDRLAELLEMMLREDPRVRPDWSYLRYWIMRNEKNIDVAPCIFWSL